jgi:hypothetical protein
VRFFWTVITLLITIILLYLLVALFVQGYFGGPHMVGNAFLPDSWSPPSTWATWRDIVIVFTGLFWLLGGVLLVALLIVLIVLALTVRRVLVEHAAPALDSLKETLDNVKGTTEFAGETVVSPIIRAYSIVSGVRSGIGAITHLPDRIRRRKRGRK